MRCTTKHFVLNNLTIYCIYASVWVGEVLRCWLSGNGNPDWGGSGGGMVQWGWGRGVTSLLLD